MGRKRASRRNKEKGTDRLEFDPTQFLLLLLLRVPHQRARKNEPGNYEHLLVLILLLHERFLVLRNPKKKDWRCSSRQLDDESSPMPWRRWLSRHHREQAHYQETSQRLWRSVCDCGRRRSEWRWEKEICSSCSGGGSYPRASWESTRRSLRCRMSGRPPSRIRPRSRPCIEPTELPTGRDKTKWDTGLSCIPEGGMEKSCC